MAYETTTAVFMAGDPAILPDLISAIRKDIKSQISRLRSEGVTESGFFGSSLGLWQAPRIIAMVRPC